MIPRNRFDLWSITALLWVTLGFMVAVMVFVNVHWLLGAPAMIAWIAGCVVAFEKQRYWLNKL